MQKKLLAYALIGAVIAMSLTACVIPGKYRPKSTVSTECTNGSVVVEVKYGDSYLKVTPKAKLKRDAGVKFVLKPKNEVAHSKNGSKESEDLLVTIKGERYDRAPGTSGGTEDLTWLDKSGTAGPNPHRYLVACADAEQAEGTYFYSVEVEHVGKLDPRADVAK